MAVKSGELLGSLATPDEEQARGFAWAELLWRLLTVVLAAALIIVYAFAIRQLWIDWQTAQADSWDFFLVWLLAPFQFAILLLRLRMFAGEAARENRLRPRVLALRAALRAGDEWLAPLAAIQPEPHGDDEGGPGPKRIGPLRPLRDARLMVADILAIVAIVFGFTMGSLAAILLILALTPDTPAPPPLWLGVALGVPALACLIAGIWQIVRSARAGRAQALEADDAGLRWTRATRRPRQEPILWVEARAFYTVAYRAGTSIWNSRHVYLLDTGQQVIAWDVADDLDERDRAASIRLARLVVTRTRVPLRDLTAAFQEATESETPARAGARDGALAPPNSPDTPVRQVLVAAGLSPTLPETSLRGSCLAMLAVLLIFALLLPISWALQRYQTSYLAGLLAQIHAETPLFADSLSAYDLKWHIAEPTITNPNTYRYQDQSYRLSGITGDFVNSWTLDTYSDIAVEVTARELGSVGNDAVRGDDDLENDGVGLVLRVNDAGNTFVVFYVSPTDGYWWLERYQAVDAQPGHNWRLLDGGISDVIQRGPGAANTLLAVLRGGTYVLYANNRFLGSFSDGQGYIGMGITTPHSGHMGLDLNNGAITGAYTHFAVYPVRPPSSLRYV